MARTGLTNRAYLYLFVAAALLVGLAVAMRDERPDPAPESVSERGDESRLTFYCAAAVRYAVDQVVAQYREETGAEVAVQYGASNSILSQVEVNRSGDLFLAAEESYLHLAKEKGLVAETIPLSRMRPVIAVGKGNPRGVMGVADLAKAEVKLALSNPDSTAIGKMFRTLLLGTDQWPAIEANVRDHGTNQGTVTEAANALKLGAVDAAIIWDSMLPQFPEFSTVAAPELAGGVAHVHVAVLKSAKQPTAALRFARYLAACDRGLRSLKAAGHDVVDGDEWSAKPEITVYSGGINRRVLEPIVAEFEKREGVRVNVVFNGCGVLTAQMKTMKGAGDDSRFPDSFLACDRYYLNVVQDWFLDGTDVSEADIVLVVKQGNPKGVREPADLLKPGVRVALGHPDQCTIGILSRRLLEEAGVYEKLKSGGNLVQESPSSSLLVPTVATGAADVALAYVTDCRAEADRLDVLPLATPLARAVQPYSVSRASRHKELGRRLLDSIRQSRATYEAAGFRWRLEPSSPAAARPSDATAASSESERP